MKRIQRPGLMEIRNELRDWSREGGIYGNNTRVIFCPAQGRPESTTRNYRQTVINPDYNMTKQLRIKSTYNKLRSKSPPNRATSPSCLYYDVTHLSLTTVVVAFHNIPSCRPGCARNLVRHVKLWRRLARALHCDTRDCLTPGVVALHISPPVATTTVSCQKPTWPCYNISHYHLF